MSSPALKRRLAALAVAAGLLVAAPPAGAHAGVADGTSNTVMLATPDGGGAAQADGIIAILIGVKGRLILMADQGGQFF
jgi:hypothetical protein